MFLFVMEINSSEGVRLGFGLMIRRAGRFKMGLSAYLGQSLYRWSWPQRLDGGVYSVVPWASVRLKRESGVAKQWRVWCLCRTVPAE